MNVYPVILCGGSSKQRLERWLWTCGLPLWWSLGADHVAGGFREALGPDGAPVESQRRMRVQARQVYVYATAARLGWNGPWRSAIAHGLAALDGRYRREDGLYRTLVSPTGAVLDDSAYLYDQAFVLLALAAAASAVPEDFASLRGLAYGLLDRVQAHYRHPAGGFREPSAERPFQSNPHMHLLEATMSWDRLDPSGPWAGVAAAIVELCLERFIDPASGAVREFFDADWAPAPGLDGRILEPGHQFEWAWLLEQWGSHTKDARARAAALRLFEAGEAGVDPQRAAAQDSVLDDGTLHLATARLWPQTERLKAAHVLAEATGEQRFADIAEQSAELLLRYLDTPTPGLWRDRLAPDGKFVDEAAPASSFYHLIAAIAEMDGKRIIASSR